jgi:hypothetical protein
MSALDDKFNTTDMTVLNRHINQKGENKVYTALSIDVTNSEKGLIDKIQNIQYYLQNYPHLLKNQLFLDEQTGTVGEKIIPQIALYDSRDNLDIRMANWINEDNGKEFVKNDLTQLKYLSQALFQTAIFTELSDPSTAAGKKLNTHYGRNLGLMKREILNKINQYKIIPQTNNTIETLSEAFDLPTNTIRNSVCKKSDMANPVLHKVAWGS